MIPSWSHAAVVNESDIANFESEFPNPLSEDYVPWFFNRGSEYGKLHRYLECMAHALPNRKVTIRNMFVLILTSQIIETCSARFFLSSTHFPLPVSYTALIESIRVKNTDFLDDLRLRLLDLVSPADSESKDSESVESKNNNPRMRSNPLPLRASDVEEFIHGAFRNVSIQIHQGKGSHARELTRHRGTLLYCTNARLIS